ncbi:MAG: hypothetical protein ABH811_00930 [archaeon]
MSRRGPDDLVTLMTKKWEGFSLVKGLSEISDQRDDKPEPFENSVMFYGSYYGNRVRFRKRQEYIDKNSFDGRED